MTTVSHLHTQYEIKKRSIICSASRFPCPRRDVLRQDGCYLIIWGSFLNLIPSYTCLYHHYESHPPLLTAAKTSYLGVSCGRSLLREGADWRLPGTTATPLRAHSLSFGLQHVYLLPPLLLFRGHISMCVYKSVNKYMCQTVNHL